MNTIDCDVAAIELSAQSCLRGVPSLFLSEQPLTAQVSTRYFSCDTAIQIEGCQLQGISRNGFAENTVRLAVRKRRRSQVFV